MLRIVPLIKCFFNYPVPVPRKYKSKEALMALKQLYSITPYPTRFELGMVARHHNMSLESARVSEVA